MSADIRSYRIAGQHIVGVAGQHEGQQQQGHHQHILCYFRLSTIAAALHTLSEGWKLSLWQPQPQLSWLPLGSLRPTRKARPEVASTLMMVAPIVVAGRRARPMATACAQDPRDKANTEARGTLGSKSRGSTLGQGRHGNFVLVFTDLPKNVACQCCQLWLLQ